MADLSKPCGRSYGLCPYTLRPLSELENAVQAHIFPHAIGGSLDYAVWADGTLDSELGRTLDAAVVDSPLIRGYRCLLRIHSRSGPSEWVLRGRLKGSSTRVEVAFDSAGNMRTRVHDRTTGSRETGAYTVIASRQEAERVIRDLVRGMRKRSQEVDVRGPAALGCQLVALDLGFDSVAVKRALLKIAFLATYAFLGDDWLEDPLIPDWHAVLFAEDPTKLDTLKLRARAFGEGAEVPETLKMLFPKLAMDKHGVVVVHVPEVGIIVAAILFANPLFSIVATASDTDDYGVREMMGKTAICDVRSRRTQVGPWGGGMLGGWSDA